VCPVGYIDTNCSTYVDCSYWDEEAGTWSKEGLTSTVDNGALVCTTTHLTTFGGVLDFPTSAAELLAELAAAFKFNSFSLDEMADLLANFNFADNITIMSIIFAVLTFDALTVFWLGFYRGYRGRQRRARDGTEFVEEKEAKELKAMVADVKLVLTTGKAPPKKPEGDGAPAGAPAATAASAMKALRAGRPMNIHEIESKKEAGIRNRAVALRDDALAQALARKAASGEADDAGAGAIAPASAAEVGAGSGPVPLLLARPEAEGVEGSAEEEAAATGLDLEAEKAALQARLMELQQGQEEEVEVDTALGKRTVVMKKRMSATDKLREVAALNAALRDIQRASRKALDGEEDEDTVKRTRFSVRIMEVVNDYWGRLVETARNEHTVINLLRPPDDEEGLMPAQMVQIFWNTIAVELFVCCWQYSGSDEDEGTGGGRRGGGGVVETARGDAWEKETQFIESSMFTIAPISALSSGVIASGMALLTISFCAYVFRWGNSRRRKPYPWVEPVKAAKAKYRSYRRKWRRWYFRVRGKVAPVTSVDWLEEDSRDDDDDDEEEPFGGAQVVDEKPGLTQLGWIAFIVGCVVCPGFNMLVLCLPCFRKQPRGAPKRPRRRFFAGKRSVVVAPDADENWFYVDAAKQQAGPISEDEVRQKLTSGEVRSELVWRAGMEQWTRASTLPQFAQTTVVVGPRRTLVAVPDLAAEPEAAEAAAEEEAACSSSPTAAPSAETGGEQAPEAAAPEGAVPEAAAAAPVADPVGPFEASPPTSPPPSPPVEGEAVEGEAIKGEAPASSGTAPVEVEAPAASSARVEKGEAIEGEAVVDEAAGGPTRQPMKRQSTLSRLKGGRSDRQAADNEAAGPTRQMKRQGTLSKLKAPPMGTALKAVSPLKAAAQLKKANPKMMAAAAHLKHDLKKANPKMIAGFAKGVATGTLVKTGGALKATGGLAKGAGGLAKGALSSPASRALGAKLNKASSTKNALKDVKIKYTSTGEVKVLTKITDLATLTILAKEQQKLTDKMQFLGWRPPWQYQLRYKIAWTVNIIVLLQFMFVSLIYALKFGEQATANMVMSWVLAYGVTFALVEPIQVILLVCAPCLFDENTKCGRCMGRCRFVYNELCAP